MTNEAKSNESGRKFLGLDTFTIACHPTNMKLYVAAGEWTDPAAALDWWYQPYGDPSNRKNDTSIQASWYFIRDELAHLLIPESDELRPGEFIVFTIAMEL